MPLVPSIAADQKAPFIRPTLHPGRPNQSPLVGRQPELKTMQAVLQALENTASTQPLSNLSPTQLVFPQSNQIHLLLLTGDPGIGKTRLAEEISLIADAREWAVAWSRSFEQENTIPYRPWTKLLRVLLQDAAPLIDDLMNSTPLHRPTLNPPFKLDHLIPLLPDLLQPTATSLHPLTLLPYEQGRQYLWEATLGLFDILSNSNPLLLVFDDLQWSDDSSIELLAYLARHLQNRRVLLLATCRDAELPSQSKLHALITDLRREQAIVTIAVQSLTQTQIESLISHLPADLIQSIQAQAAGNPFFAEELARSVSMLYLERDFPAATSTRQTPPPLGDAMFTQGIRTGHATMPPANKQLPEAITAVLKGRLSKLSRDCQVLLSKAAVLGGSFELDLIMPMSNEQTEETVINLLDEALYAGLLTEEEVGEQIFYHFWHPLIISHLYQHLSAARRAFFHRKAAEVLQATSRENIAASIFNHLSKGGSTPGALARYSELAGNQAYVVAAYAEAQHYYLQTIQIIAGEALQLPTGASLQIRDITPQIIMKLPIPVRLHISQLLDRIAECHVVPGNYEDARYLYECILAVRSKNDVQLITSSHADDSSQVQRETETHALLWREIGNTWSATGEYDRAYECYRRGSEVLQRAGVTTGIAWASLHSRYGLKLRFDGQNQEARHYLQEALAVLETCIEPPTVDRQQSGVFLATSEKGNTPLASPQGQPQRALHTRIERTLWGNPFELGYAHEQLGVNLVNSGPLSDALKHLHIALSIYEQCGLLSEMAHASGNLGAVYIMKGEHATAHDFLYRSLELTERIGDLPNMTFVTSNLGDVALRSGDLLTAEGWFKRSLDLAEHINDREGISWSSIELACVQRDLGKLEDARQHLLHALIIGRAIKNPRCVLYALVKIGELRIAEALHSCSFPVATCQDHSLHETACKRLLFRARSTLQRALCHDGLEIEPFIDGQLQLATTYYLLGENDFALQLATQTLQSALENETGRIAGCTHRLLGRIQAKQGHHEQADLSFKQALSLFHTNNLRLDYARTLYASGISVFQHKKLPVHHSTDKDYPLQQIEAQTGLASLQEAQRIFSDCHATLDLTWIEHTLNATHLS
jgi:tetratricopeptide (TPR) repeat protein